VHSFSPLGDPISFACPKEIGERKRHPVTTAFGFPALLSKQGVCGTRYAQTVLDETPLLTSVARRG